MATTSTTALGVGGSLSVAGGLSRRALGVGGVSLRPRSLARARMAVVRASAARQSVKEKAAAGLTAAAMAAALVLPEVAQAAGPGLSPSLKNFLLSIVSGGVVLAVIAGAVVAVSNFDPVRRD